MQRTVKAGRSGRGASVLTSKVWLLGAVLVLMGSAELAVAAKTENATERASLERGRLVVADEVLNVEVAQTAAERSRGLMERDSLPDDAGMLFLYSSEQPATSAYWMYRTRIALDIAFVDSRGVIRSLKTMSPCHAAQSSQCPVYPAGAPFRAALETNAGYFDRHGIGEGDRIDLAPWLASP